MKKRDQTTMNWRRKSGHDDIQSVQGGVATVAAVEILSVVDFSALAQAHDSDS